MKKWLWVLVTTLLVICIILAGCGAPKPSPAAGIELKLMYHFPKPSPLGQIMVAWSETIEKDAGGKVTITHFPAGSLAKMQDTYDALISGMGDIAVVEPGMTPGSFPLSEISTLPMLFPSGEVLGEAYYDLLVKYCVDTELKDVKVLWTMPLSPMQIISNKPIEKLEDFKGLKMRIEGKVEDMTVQALGSTGVLLDTMDMYTSFERGLIDGAFFLFNGILAYGFQEVTKYRTKADVLGRAFIISMNKDSWSKLSPDIQQIFEKHGLIEYSAIAGKMIDEFELGAAKTVAEYDKNVGNPPIYVLPETERARWVEELIPIQDAWAEEIEALGLPGKAMLADAKDLAKKYSK